MFDSAKLKTLTDLTHASFAEFVRSNRFAVIHFWAAWNGYDATMEDILERQIPAEVQELIAFARVDTDRGENQETCRQLQLRNLPSLALYRSGALIEIVTGLREPDEIAERRLSPRCQAHQPRGSPIIKGRVNRSTPFASSATPTPSRSPSLPAPPSAESA